MHIFLTEMESSVSRVSNVTKTRKVFTRFPPLKRRKCHRRLFNSRVVKYPDFESMHIESGIILMSYESNCA